MSRSGSGARCPYSDGNCVFTSNGVFMHVNFMNKSYGNCFVSNYDPGWVYCGSGDSINRIGQQLRTFTLDDINLDAFGVHRFPVPTEFPNVTKSGEKEPIRVTTEADVYKWCEIATAYAFNGQAGTTSPIPDSLDTAPQYAGGGPFKKQFRQTTHPDKGNVYANGAAMTGAFAQCVAEGRTYIGKPFAFKPK